MDEESEKEPKEVTEEQAADILETMRKVLEQFETLKVQARESGAIALLEKRGALIQEEVDEMQDQLDLKKAELEEVNAQVALLGGTAVLVTEAPKVARGRQQPKAVELLKMKGNGATVSAKEVETYAGYASSGAAGAFLTRAVGWGAVDQPGGPGTPYIIKNVSKLP